MAKYKYNTVPQNHRVKKDGHKGFIVNFPELPFYHSASLRRYWQICFTGKQMHIRTHL